MKKDDFEELDDEIIDDEILDDDEVIDDEETLEAQDVELEDKPQKKVPASKKALEVKKKAQNSHNKKKGISKGTKIAIISSSAAVGVIAIALVVLLVVLPMMGISVFHKNTGVEPYYDSTSSVGLYFYGDDHTALNDDYSSGTVDMIRAKTGLSKSYFDPSKPTIIWFHGWEPTGSVGDRYLMAGGDTRKVMDDYDCQYAQELKAKGYNVGTFQFQGVNSSDKNYAKGLSSIYKYAVQSFDKGEYSMSFMFASEILTIFGETYAKDITFVGHSCGGFVSTATNYMLQYFYQKGYTANKHLIASRMIIEDPYVDTLGDKLDSTAVLMGTDEVIGDRSKCVVVQDMMTSLHKNSNVAIDVYLGMSGASDSFIESKSHFSEVKNHVVITDMTGLKEWLGAIGNIHVMTRDWVWRSMLEDKLEDQNGNLAPSAACTNAEILGLIGNLYQQTNTEWDFDTEYLEKVSDTSGFKFS